MMDNIPLNVRQLAQSAADAWIEHPRCPISDMVADAIMLDRQTRKSARWVGLTAAHRQALLFIEKYSSEHGYSPSFDDIRWELGLKSKSGVHRIVNALEERGRIARLPNRARTIVVIEGAA